MDFEFSAEQEELRLTVRRFLDDRAPLRPYVRDQLDDPRGVTVAVWKGLADLGAVGLLVPERYGGAGLGMLDMGAVLEEMGRHVHPGPFRSSAVGAISAVMLGGSAQDHAALLPSLASGERIGAVVLDPGVEASPAGASWAVSGAVPMVRDAAGADLLVVLAADGPAPRLFAVEAGDPGVETVPVESVDGTTKFGRVVLDGARARLLGNGDDTDANVRGVIRNIADRLAVADAVDGVGAAGAALEMAVSYARERVQFDRAIGSFQAVQHLCADMLEWVELARAGTYYALWALDGAEPDERHRAATMALAYAADMLHRVGAGAIQVLGGIGFTWEHDAHLYYKRLLTLQEAGGGAAAQYDELAGIILG